MNFEEHLSKYLNKEQISKLVNSFNEESIRAVLLNPQKMNKIDFINLYPNVKRHPIVDNAFIYSPKEYELGKSLYHELGCFYIQEPSAMVPSWMLNPTKDDIVLDLCAAPGGKSIQASFLMENEGIILSNDLSHSRALAIKENIERLGIKNITALNNDFLKIYNKFIDSFDCIILDAPCSGSGMFRKSDLMIKDWSYNKVLKFAEIQKELILYSYKMLKPGGKMCYSTCSFSYEEDEEVIDFLLEKTDAEIIEINDNPLFYKTKGHGIHLFPSVFPGDGQYVCLIKKPGSIKKNKFDIIAPKTKLDFKITNTNVFEEENYIFGTLFKSNVKDLFYIRKGVKIGERIHDKIIYDVHFARCLKSASNSLDLTKEDTIKYIKGETLNICVPKGNYLLLFNGLPIDISNSDGRIIKNHYPKYLRKLLS